MLATTDKTGMVPTGDDGDGDTTAVEAGESDHPDGADFGGAVAVGGSRDAEVQQGALSGDLQQAEHPVRRVDNNAQ